MIYIILGIVTAYIIGSIPTAYIFGKLKGIDIRECGSGNVGATNVARNLGKIPGIMVFVVDFLKGLIPVVLIPIVIEYIVTEPLDISSSLFKILLGSSAILGHIFTIFLRFKGGKGVSTTAGVMAALSPISLVVGLVLWTIIFKISKYVSLASIIASISLPITAVIIGKSVDFVIFCSILCLGGVYFHRENIKRLIQGTENKV